MGGSVHFIRGVAVEWPHEVAQVIVVVGLLVEDQGEVAVVVVVGWWAQWHW